MYDNWTVEGATASAQERESHDGIILATMSGVSPEQGPLENKNDGVHKINTIKEAIKRFGDDTTFHGVRFATDYKVNRYRRLLWFVIIGGMSSYLVYGVVKSTQTYFDYPVTSIVKITHPPALDFPAVTFCNFNWWRKSKIDPEFNQAFKAVNEDGNTDDANSSVDLKEVYNMSERLRVAGHQIEDMLMLCTFKGKKCSAADFTQVITDFGLCYSFNDDNSNHTIHHSGSSNSLFMQIDLEQDLYLPGLNRAVGIKLLIHPRGQYPLVSELGIAISPGLETFVGLKLTQIVNQHSPYASDCIDEELRHYRNYTVPICQYIHKTEFISKKCGCRDLRYPAGAFPECKLREYSSCLFPAKANFSGAEKSAKCRIPCYLTVYEPRVSFAHWPGKHQVDDIEKDFNMSESDIRNNLLRIKIFFEEISHRRIEEVPSFTFRDLQSNIGGYMGLLIGASLITLFEFLDFILVTLVTLATHLAGRDEDRSKKANVARK